MASSNRYDTPEKRAKEAARKRAAYAKDTAQAQLRTREKRSRLSSRTDDEVLKDTLRLRPGSVKLCRTCRAELPLAEFASDRARADGLNRACRACDYKARRNRKTRAWEAYWAEVGIDATTCSLCEGPYEHADHVYPLILHGPDESWNVLPLCAAHNLNKNSKAPRPYFEGLIASDPDPVVRKKATVALNWFSEHIEPRLRSEMTQASSYRIAYRAKQKALQGAKVAEAR